MNAYELADFIDKYCVDNTSKESAILLRQQADRIAELEKQRWTEKDLKNACRNARLSEDDFLRIKAYLPVYTTPQTKPLSDEEIVQLKAEIAAHKKTNELLAQKIEQLEKELSK